VKGFGALPLVGERILDDIHLAKPKGFCKRGTDAPSAVQNRTEFAAIKVIAFREGGLTSLAFNCGLQQINDVIIIKQIAHFARRVQSDVFGTSLISGHVHAKRGSR
jgi:hypothetical protein